MSHGVVYLVPFLLSLLLVLYGLRSIFIYAGKLAFSQRHKKKNQKRYLVKAIIAFILALLFVFSIIFYITPLHVIYYNIGFPYVVLFFCPFFLSLVLILDTVDFYRAYVYVKKNSNKGGYLLVFAIIYTILSILVTSLSLYLYYGVLFRSGFIYYLF